MAALIEMSVTFGLVIAFCIWQIRATRKPPKPDPREPERPD